MGIFDFLMGGSTPSEYIYTPAQSYNGAVIGGYYSSSAISPDTTVIGINTPSGFSPVTQSDWSAQIAMIGQRLTNVLNNVPYQIGAGIGAGEGAAGAALLGMSTGIIVIIVIAALILSSKR